MACDKCFTFMESFYRQTELMSDEQALRFFKAMCAFAFDDAEPDFENDLVLKVSWVTASSAIESNLRARADGKKGGRPKKKTVDKTTVETGDKTPLKTQEDFEKTAEFDDSETPLKTPLKPNEIKGNKRKGNKRNEQEEKRKEILDSFYNQTA